MERALKFYSDAFGWTGKEHGIPSYQIVENQFKNLNGALRLVTEEEHVAGTAVRHTMKPFIGLHSIKEPLAKVKEAGGEIIKSVLTFSINLNPNQCILMIVSFSSLVLERRFLEIWGSSASFMTPSVTLLEFGPRGCH